jgi:hypothetical protein
LVGFRFSPEVIILAVRAYLRFGISYRDVEELLAERGIDVDHVSIYRWVQGSPRLRCPQSSPAQCLARHTTQPSRPTKEAAVAAEYGIEILGPPGLPE